MLLDALLVVYPGKLPLAVRRGVIGPACPPVGILAPDHPTRGVVPEVVVPPVRVVERQDIAEPVIGSLGDAAVGILLDDDAPIGVPFGDVDLGPESDDGMRS